MSDLTNPIPDPAAAEPVVEPVATPAAEPAAAATTEAPALHPSWDAIVKDLEVLPEAFKAPILQKIRETDAEATKRIAELQARVAPDEWRDFISKATDSKTNPADYEQAFSAAQQIMADPVEFSILLNNIIDDRMALPATDPNHLTSREGYRAKKDVAAATDATTLGDEAAFESDEAKEIKALRDRLDAQERERQTQTQAQQQQQEAAAAEAYGQEFVDSVNTLMDGATDQQKFAVGQIGTAIAQQEATAGRAIGAKAVVEKAIEIAKSSGLSWAVPAGEASPAAPAAGAPPVGAGAGTATEAPVPLGDVGSREGEKARREAMLNAASGFTR